MTQPLTLRPLQQALRENAPEIHHGNQSVQSLSNTDYGIAISLAYRGSPWENCYVERLIRTLKEEEVYLNDYDNLADASSRIGHFIEQVYNQKRPHSAFYGTIKDLYILKLILF